jgi:hypothetical protein
MKNILKKKELNYFKDIYIYLSINGKLFNFFIKLIKVY